MGAGVYVRWQLSQYYYSSVKAPRAGLVYEQLHAPRHAVLFHGLPGQMEGDSLLIDT